LFFKIKILLLEVGIVVKKIGLSKKNKKKLNFLKILLKYKNKQAVRTGVIAFAFKKIY
jgi:acetolactate synthase small subunit